MYVVNMYEMFVILYLSCEFCITFNDCYVLIMCTECMVMCEG